MTIRKITVTSTQVSNDANTSTGAFDLPAGTTAQRPSSPTSGNLRFNTTLQTTEIYDGNNWGKVSPLTPVISSITGKIYNTLATNLTLSGSNFLTGSLDVTFTPSGGSASTVTVTPTSDVAATVAVPSAIYGLSVATLVSVTVTNTDNRTSAATQMAVNAIPTGGDHIVNDGLTRTHIFKQSANFVVPSQLTNVDFLVVAGGGQGGRWYRGGGGGAGGLRSSIVNTGGASGSSVESKLTITAATHSITVGAGGTSAQANNSTSGGNGGNSSIGSQIVSIGGGGGGSWNGGVGQSGGSGGGACSSSTATSGGAGSGTSGQGFQGGERGASTSIQCGSGGGGAGAVGQRGGNDTDYSGEAGFGGDGVINTIISSTVATAQSVGEVVGSDVYYGGGGSGSSYTDGNLNVTSGGGLGGGADGVHTVNGSNDYRDGVNAAANTGGGGSGANGQVTSGNAALYSSLSSGDYLTGGDGGSGVVIIKYTLS